MKRVTLGLLSMISSCLLMNNIAFAKGLTISNNIGGAQQPIVFGNYMNRTTQYVYGNNTQVTINEKNQISYTTHSQFQSSDAEATRELGRSVKQAWIAYSNTGRHYSSASSSPRSSKITSLYYSKTDSLNPWAPKTTVNFGFIRW